MAHAQSLARTERNKNVVLAAAMSAIVGIVLMIAWGFAINAIFRSRYEPICRAAGATVDSLTEYDVAQAPGWRGHGPNRYYFEGTRGRCIFGNRSVWLTGAQHATIASVETANDVVAVGGGLTIFFAAVIFGAWRRMKKK